MFHIHRISVVVILVLTLLTNSAFTSFAQGTGPVRTLQGDEALIEDARTYASAMRVNLDEALRRLRLQEKIADLNAQLRIIGLRNQLGMEMHTGLNLSDNLVEVYVRDQAKFTTGIKRAGETLPEHVKVVPVNLELRNVARIYGGLQLDTSAPGICTSGFSVRKPSTGEKGIITAGHCTDPISRTGIELTPGDEVLGTYDIAWYKSSGFRVRNWMWDGSAKRAITYGRIRSMRTVGAGVCKYGVAGGKRCGQVVDNAFDGVNVRTNYLAEGGDSGGPNFISQEAWGTTISLLKINGQPVGTIYAPVDNHSALLGVVILTQ